MAYSEEIHRLAMDKLSDVRDGNFYKKEKLKKEIFDKFPEISKLKSEETKLLSFLVSNFSDLDKLKEIKEAVIAIEEKIEDILVKNNYGKDALTNSVNCSKCQDKGYILNKKCSCFVKILKEIAKEKSNFSSIIDKQSFKNFTLEYYKDEIDKTAGISPRANMIKNLNKINLFIDEFQSSNSLVFMGKTGLGKTFMASCIAGKLIDNGYSVFYQTANKLIEILEDNKFNKKPTNYDLDFAINEIYNCDLLIIDDFGTEYLNNYTITALYELISRRLMENKKMILTTNLSLENIGSQYSERMLSRILGDFQILEFFGEDVRVNKI